MDEYLQYLGHMICEDLFDYDEKTWVANIQYGAQLFQAQPPLSTLRTYQLAPYIAYCVLRLEQGNNGPDSQYFTEGHAIANRFWSCLEELTSRKLARLNANVEEKPLDPDLELPL